MITHPGGKPMCPVEDQLRKTGEQDEPHHCYLRIIDHIDHDDHDDHDDIGFRQIPTMTNDIDDE